MIKKGYKIINKVEFRFFLFLVLFNCLPITIFGQNDTKKKEQLEVDSIAERFSRIEKLTKDFKYQEALNLITSSIEASIRIKNDSLVAIGYIQLGRTYVSLNKLDLALEANKKAIRYAEKANKNIGIVARAYNNIGYAYYQNSKEIDSAIHYMKKALKLNQKIRNIKYMAIQYSNLGELYEKKNQLDSAVVFLEKSAYYSKLVKDYYGLGLVYEEFSILYLKLKDTTKSINYLNQSLEVSKKHDFNEILVRQYLLKYKILKNKKEYIKALSNLEEHQNLKVKTYKSNLTKINEELTTKYQLKQKEELIEKVKIENKEKEKSLSLSKILFIITFVLVLIFIFLAYVFYKNNHLKKVNSELLVSKNEELRKIQLKTELNFLRNQIQPHFFFNTLNNLYALVLEKSEKAETVVVKLSRLMKYAIYSTKKGGVSIWDEVKNIQNYLELEFLRHNIQELNPVKIEGGLATVEVPPLLFTTFVENCFKHGNVYDKDFKLAIFIKRIDTQYVLFSVKNTFEMKKKDIKKDNTKNGVGLENTRRRLELLYKSNYQLDFNIENSVYHINLKIPTNF